MAHDNNTIFDFKKIKIISPRKYVEIITDNGMGSLKDEIDIENKEDAYNKIRDFIMEKEYTNEIIFEVGICKNLKCIEECNQNNYCAPKTCGHRIAEFAYCDEFTYIKGSLGTIYKIKIFA